MSKPKRTFYIAFEPNSDCGMYKLYVSYKLYKQRFCYSEEDSLYSLIEKTYRHFDNLDLTFKFIDF